MSTQLPTMTRTIDDQFVNTWYEIRSEVIDQVMTSNVLLLALQEKGCMQTQVGGTYATRTVGYGTKSSQRIGKGSTLNMSDPPLDTMAYWNWRYAVIDVVRALIGPNSDQENNGPEKIKDYLARKVENAIKSLKADFETYLFQWGNFYPTPRQFNGIYDIVAPSSAKTTTGGGSNSDTYNADVSAGTATNSSGMISRSNNSWWRNQLKAPTGALALTLVADMRNFFNTLTQANSSPKLILCSQDLYETYEDEGLDKVQIVRTGFDQKAFDLGFATQTFKGASMIYSPKMPTLAVNTLSEALFIDTDYLEFVYDPTMWFEMTNWKESVNQLERVAYIVCAAFGLISSQPRAHGYLGYTS